MFVPPALYRAGEELIGKLDRFVQNGGVLVSSFKSFVADRNLTVYDDAQPHGLSACFGISYNQFTDPGRTTVQGKPVRYFMELLKPDGAETLALYEHRYWGSYAALTRHAYGDGAAYYVGGFVEKEQLKEVYKKAAADAGIGSVFSDAKVTVRSGRNPEGCMLHYVFNYSEEVQNVVCPFEKAEDLLSGAEYQKGDTITLGDWNLVILEEK
jgi:beta-galactosidase